ncbi:efflux RND transporter periplasmic adaptor subunit [Pontibacter sp. E15-1]|uniref:efflux RND transporter periplasmic adaptor subunit n=1 Tax=Pontibacter sp. E15-1 TaxID=2919918 RepID=UPI001F4F98EF|nr:efflux RND transporter periplasmic adaptor subunit [Pontibacter sp. E15-1]MCJ8167351.1 efflux RND transporter periplasmic adaptor subunit [Pontibacter sp. E15-1]
MKRILYIPVLFLLSGFIFTACEQKTEPAQAEAEGQAGAHHEESPFAVALTQEQYQVAGIALGKLEMRSLSHLLTVTGMLDLPPQNLASVSAPMGGFVKNTELLEGMKVKKGQLIAKIENPEFVTLQQQYLEANNRLDFLKLEYERQQELSEEQVTSAKTFQQATAEYRTASAQVEALAERLRIVGLNPATLKAGKISRILPLYSPIEGYVTLINANIGQYVNPTDVLFRIADTEHLHVELTVFEKDVASLKKGQVVRYALPGEATAHRKATIYLIGKEISPERTVRVHAHMEDEDKDLVPGMYVQAQVALNGQQLLALPEAAVVQDQGRDAVFLFLGEEKEGEATLMKFRLVPVEKGVTEGGYAQVALPATVDAASAQFVTKGAYSLLSKLRNAEDEEGGHH